MINTTPIYVLIGLLLHLTATTAQPPPPTATPSPPPPHPLAPGPAPAPSPAKPTPPPSITKILKKAKGFSRFLGLMTRTQVVNRLETELNGASKQNQGVTVFAPRNKAFAGMKSGALNSLSSDQLAKLVLFHCVPSFLALSDFEAVTNPLITEAGDASNGAYMLNLITTGNQVNFSTGVGHNEATVVSTVYSNTDQQLAVYEVSRMLLPKAIFPVPPFLEAPAPAPEANAGKSGGGSAADASSSDGGDSGSGKSSGGGGGSGGGSTNNSSSGRCGGSRGYSGVVSLVVGVLVVLIWW